MKKWMLCTRSLDRQLLTAYAVNIARYTSGVINQLRMAPRVIALRSSMVRKPRSILRPGQSRIDPLYIPF